MWNAFIERVDADSETMNGRSNRHRQLLDDIIRWQCSVSCRRFFQLQPLRISAILVSTSDPLPLPYSALPASSRTGYVLRSLSRSRAQTSLLRNVAPSFRNPTTPTLVNNPSRSTFIFTRPSSQLNPILAQFPPPLYLINEPRHAPIKRSHGHSSRAFAQGRVRNRPARDPSSSSGDRSRDLPHVPLLEDATSTTFCLCIVFARILP